MKFLSKFLFALLVTFSIFSCERELVDDQAQRGNSSGEIELRGSDGDNIMDQRFEVAKATSFAVLEVKELMPLFVNLANDTEATGYYEKEFFLGKEKDIERKELGNRSIHDVLVEFGGKNMDEILANLCKNDKGLTFLIEGTPQKENYSTRVYIDDNFDESGKNPEIKFYEDGQMGSHSINISADMETVVVRESESFYTEKTAKEEGLDMKELVPIGDICGDFVWGTGGPSGGSGGGGPTGGGGGGDTDECDCERDCIDKTENIRRFRAKHDYDSWRGRGEFIFYSILADDVAYTIDSDGYPQLTGNPLHYLRNRITGVRGNWQWYYPDFSLHVWDKEDDGDEFKVLVIEDDGKKKEFNVKLTFKIDIPLIGETGFESTLPITINDGGDYIGDYLVNYCHDIDPSGFAYNPAAGSEAVTVRHNER